MTERERVIISAYTGYLMCDFHKVHQYIEEVFGRPVFTHEIGDPSFQKELQKLVKSDFLALCEPNH